DSDPRGAGPDNDPAAGAATALVVTDQAKDSDTQPAHQEPPIATEMPVAAGPEAAGADGGGPPRFRPPQPPQPQQQASPPRRAAPLAPRPVVLPQPVAQGCLSLRDAAVLGNANAQYSLGEMYANGTGGVTQDFTQAVSWYRQAAVQGHAEAQYRLGVMFENGSGVASNQILAMSWYRQAAKQNHCGAQFKLGEHYRDVKQNLREAYAWFSLAATNGHADALRARDEIAAQLTPDELDSAQQIMARYVAQSQPKK
ncbi:MAG: tetratricopeptide repeat protein, partial [Enterovibrio sp.]